RRHPMSDMRRREFTALIGGVGLLLAVKVRRARGQQSAKIPRIGIIDDSLHWNAFRHGLRDLGYLEGGNITFDYAYGDGVPERRPRQRSYVARWTLLRPTPRPRAWRPSKPPPRFPLS